MTGQHLCETALNGDAAKVSTLLSTQCAQSFINYQDADGSMPIHFAAASGHVAVAKQLIAGRRIYTSRRVGKKEKMEKKKKSWEGHT